jgi:hypothetical protein
MSSKGSLVSYEEIVQILVDNHLDNYRKYKEFYSKNDGKYQNKILPKKPWHLDQTEKSCVSFFWKIFPNRKTTYQKRQRFDLEKHLEIIRDNNLITIKKYQEYFSENKEKEKGLYANPWTQFGFKRAWSFFDMAIPDRRNVKKEIRKENYKLTNEEIIEIMAAEKLFSARSHRQYFLENRKCGLPARPWDRFNMKEAEFFDTYFPQRKKIESLEEIKEIFLANKITSSVDFRKFIRENPNHNIKSNFCKMNNTTFSNFLDYVWGYEREKCNILNLEEFVKFLQDNKLFSFTMYKRFYKENKNNNPRIPVNPMVSYKMTQPEIFELAFPISKFSKGRLHQKTNRCDVILFLSEKNVQNIFQYKEIEKELPLLKNILKTENDSSIEKVLEEVASVNK